MADNDKNVTDKNVTDAPDGPEAEVPVTTDDGEQVNALGQPRTTETVVSDPYGRTTRPKYEQDDEEKGPKDPHVEAIPGSDLARTTDNPESPHLGGRYVPGSANRTDA